MLHITIPEREFFDEETSTFVFVKETSLRLEHSLIAVAKWEAKWKVPFLTEEEKTVEQSRDYVRCMTLNQNVNPQVYLGLTEKNMADVRDYMNTEQTATWFSDTSRPSREIVTSELIYYMMTAYQIPWEAQKWHLSRLMTLIRICNIKNQPEKKMSSQQILNRNKALNAARRAKLKSKG